MIEQATCWNCKFWRCDHHREKSTEIIEFYKGICVRHAPQMPTRLLLPGSGSHRHDTDAEWPRTKAQDFCGDFVEDPPT